MTVRSESNIAAGSRVAGDAGENVRTMPACSATRKDGKPCRAAAVRDGVCMGHHKALREAADKTRRELKERYGGTMSRPREIDLLITKLSERADEVTDKLLQIALEAEKPVVVAGTKDEPGFIEMVPDYDVQLKALRELYDRVHGRPAQALKLGGIEGGAPIPVSVPRNEERARKVAEILARQGAIPHEGRRRPANAGTNSARPQEA